jgi:hypothetical protein
MRFQTRRVPRIEETSQEPILTGMSPNAGRSTR